MTETFTSLEEIPESLVFKWDQTAIKYVPVPDWTMDEKGTKKVKLAGLDDRRQITAVFAATMSGDFYHCNLSIKVQPVPVYQLINFQIRGM